LTTQKLTHSDNLSSIYGEDKLEDMQKVIEMTHPKDAHKVVDTLTQAAEGKIEKYDISYRSKGSNLKEYRHYRAVGELVRDAMDNPEKLVGTVQDITAEVKQKQEVEKAYQKIQASEEELQQNYEELQAIQEQLLLVQYLIDNSQDAIQASRVDGRFVYMNHIAAERLGVSSKEYANYFVQDVEAIFKEKGSWEAHVEEVKKVGGITIESENTNRTTGKSFPVEVGVRYVDINGEGYMMASSRDITERKKAEQEIKAKNEALQVSEEELKQNLKELQTTQELLENQNKNIESAFNELQNTQNQLIQSEKMASLGQLVANIAHEINTPLGAIRSSAMSIEEILNTTLPSLPSLLKRLDDQAVGGFNELVGMSIKKIDILSSREKRAIKYDLIEELEELKIQNPEEYADWIVDMNIYDEKTIFLPLLKKEDAREIFQTAYQISNIIRSNQTVRTATDRAAKIVFALKNYARQDQTGEKATVNINDSIETTLTLYHNQIKHGIDVTRDLADIPEFMGYPDELVQVWTNIIHNALQAMNNKGCLFIQTSVENNNALVSIQDNGGGIPKEVQDRIFDAFFTTKGAGQGSGLGLDITRKIIEKHNGKIWFDSSEGKGTTFFVELPLTDK